MSYVLSNLDFEYRWARESRGGEPPKVVFDVARRWESILRLIVPDAHVLPVEAAQTGFSSDIQAGRQLTVWGWTPKIVEEAKKRGLVIDAPELEVVGMVNAKTFSHRFEKRQGWSLPGAGLTETIEEVERGIRSIDGTWVLKHPWGVSGREQRRGEGVLCDGTRRWAERVFGEGEALILEPFLDVEEEYSLHFEVGPQRVEEVGECILHTGSAGTLRGIGVSSSRRAPRAIRDGAAQAARAVAQRGYVGPVGIDAMVGRWKGKHLMRPVTEINARMTFGRLALALWSRLEGDKAGREMIWVHPTRGESSPVPRPWPDRWERGSFALPDDVDPGQRSRTYVELRTQESA